MSRPCPSCGHCPTCGRTPYRFNDWWSPYSPWITYTGTTIGGGTYQPTNTTAARQDFGYALAQPETKCDHGHDPDEGK